MATFDGPAEIDNGDLKYRGIDLTIFIVVSIESACMAYIAPTNVRMFSTSLLSCFGG